MNERLFWLAHLHSWADSTDAEELLYGADYEAAGAFQHRLFAQASWPTFTIPLRAGHRFHIVYRTFEEDEGVDYLLHHPDWDLAELLATEEGHFMGPGLSWPELVAAAGNALARRHHHRPPRPPAAPAARPRQRCPAERCVGSPGGCLAGPHQS